MMVAMKTLTRRDLSSTLPLLAFFGSIPIAETLAAAQSSEPTLPAQSTTFSFGKLPVTPVSQWSRHTTRPARSFPYR